MTARKTPDAKTPGAKTHGAAKPSARDQILGNIRRSLGRNGPVSGADATLLETRITEHPRGPVPDRAASLTHAKQVELFEAMAKAVQTTVSHVKSLSDLPDAVADYLKSENLPSELRMAPHPDLKAAPWEKRPTLSISEGRTYGEDAVGLSAAFAGVAETGTLVLHSGAETPTTLNFLPETEIVVLKSSQVVAAYEDMWDRLREARKDEVNLLDGSGKATPNKGAKGRMPRTVNMITGPSRTGDIEQTIELGAHGPLRLHVVIVDGE